MFGTLAPHTHRQKLADLAHPAPPLTCSGALVFAIEPLPGFEALTTALSERCAITIVYEHGWERPQPQTITPRLVLEVHGVAYLIAHCHLSYAERTFRLERIRACWLEEKGRQSWPRSFKANALAHLPSSRWDLQP